MADFLIAFRKMGIHEGGYANDPDDHGGETYRGISRVNFPKWGGWAIISMYKNKPNFPSNLESAKVLDNMVESFYKINFWHPIQGDFIDNQKIANAIFDFAVNVGVKPAVIKAQETVFNLQGEDLEKFLVSKNMVYGIMDFKTVKQINGEV